MGGHAVGLQFEPLPRSRDKGAPGAPDCFTCFPSSSALQLCMHKTMKQITVIWNAFCLFHQANKAVGPKCHIRVNK